jgi:hypothetical protein
MSNKQIEYLKSITAYDFLNETETDGMVFNTKVIMSFLMLKFGEAGALRKFKDFTQTELNDLEQMAIDEREKQKDEDYEAIDEAIDYLKNTGQLKELTGEDKEKVNGNDFFWFTPNQSKAITKTDKALEELFKAFKKGYTDNLPKN